VRPAIARSARPVRIAVPVLLIAASLATARAQDRLRAMPDYPQIQRRQVLAAGAVRSGAVTASWSADSRSFEYAHDGRRYRFDVRAGRRSEIAWTEPAEPAARRSPGGAGTAERLPERGRQHASAESPDGRYRAQYNEATRNIDLVDRASGRAVPITADGSPQRRIKYGTASWVYGEELGQTTAMWWSPDSRRLAFYRFDESHVLDYHLQVQQTRLQSAVESEAYPKAGAANPVVDLLVFDVASRQTVTLDVRDGRPFDDVAVGHYVYGVSWSPDGRELLFHRMNRRQNVLDLAAADPESSRVRVIVRRRGRPAGSSTGPRSSSCATGGASSGSRPAPGGGTSTCTTCRAG
jgi:dipeptidyl-peptidase-4